MIAWLRRFAALLSGTSALPESFSGSLATNERVLAVGHSPSGPLVATHLGLWLPEADGHRRLGWHVVSKATWDDGVLRVIESEETGSAGAAVLLRDRAALRFSLSDAGKLPDVVHARVTGSIRSSHHRELPGGGAWFVQRKIPGRDGIVLQVRGDEGTDEQVLAEIAADVSARLDRAAETGSPTPEE